MKRRRKEVTLELPKGGGRGQRRLWKKAQGPLSSPPGHSSRAGPTLRGSCSCSPQAQAPPGLRPTLCSSPTQQRGSRHLDSLLGSTQQEGHRWAPDLGAESQPGRCPKTTPPLDPPSQQRGTGDCCQATLWVGVPRGLEAKPFAPIQVASLCPREVEGLGSSLWPLPHLDGSSVLPSSPGLLCGHRREGHFLPFPTHPRLSARPWQGSLPPGQFIPPPNLQAAVSDFPATWQALPNECLP